VARTVILKLVKRVGFSRIDCLLNWQPINKPMLTETILRLARGHSTSSAPAGDVAGSRAADPSSSSACEVTKDRARSKIT
jgi:hypothetical protein